MDEVLEGGGINVVLRRGDTVLRPRGPHGERVAGLLRHLADAGFDGAPRHLADHAPAEVICHGDVAPYNCVFDGSRAVGLIDFDTAHPGPRLRDVAYAVYRFAPLTRTGPVDEQAARAVLFCDAYGDLDRTGLVATIADRLRELVAFMHARAAAGDGAFVRHIERGDDRNYQRDIAHLETGGYPSLVGIVPRSS